jgi:aryl-alcohol dehydrogenase-like predicted oxidoreductase
MEKRKLGNTELMITPIGLGAWAMGGGDWEFAWGPQDDRKSIAAIHHAVKVGINWIDTAAVYGLGHSEEVVAEALSVIPKAERPLVFTKCSLVWDENKKIRHSLAADSLRKELEGSLRRLRTEAIDLYQIHWPKHPSLAGVLGNIEEAWGTLLDLQRAGKIRYLGVSNFGVPDLERARAIAPVSSLQPPYSMLRRAVEKEILPYCEANNIGVIVYSPMGAGMLAGKMTRERIAAFPPDDWRRNNPDFQEPRLTRNLELVEKLREIGSRHGRSPAQVSIAWTLRLRAVTAAIVGARNPEQIDGFLGAAEFRLSSEEISRIESLLGETH